MTAEQSERMNQIRTALKGLDATISVLDDRNFIVAVSVKVPLDEICGLPVHVLDSVQYIFDHAFDRAHESCRG